MLTINKAIYAMEEDTFADTNLQIKKLLMLTENYPLCLLLNSF